MTRIMVIAGTDSSGGAGLTRDTATAAALGAAVQPVVTAVTVQTDDALLDSQLVPPELVAHQIRTAFDTRPPAAVKIGMLGSSETAEAVAGALAGCAVPIVLDPVLKTSSGGALSLHDDICRLLSLASLVTPNLEEAAQLTGLHFAKTLSGITAQAEALQRQGAGAVLIKGGHDTGQTATDHLFDEIGHNALSLPRLPAGRRGTGCTLATAIACHLAEGHELRDACRQAKTFVHGWIADSG